MDLCCKKEENIEVGGRGRKVKSILDEGNDSKNVLRNDSVMDFFLNNGAVERKEV